MDKETLLEKAMDAVENDELIGFCIACGGEYDSPLEPDARAVYCPYCDKDKVYGAGEIILMYG